MAMLNDVKAYAAIAITVISWCLIIGSVYIKISIITDTTELIKRRKTPVIRIALIFEQSGLSPLICKKVNIRAMESNP
jgi:hypothetical protein